MPRNDVCRSLALAQLPRRPLLQVRQFDKSLQAQCHGKRIGSNQTAGNDQTRPTKRRAHGVECVNMSEQSAVAYQAFPQAAKRLAKRLLFANHSQRRLGFR